MPIQLVGYASLIDIFLGGSPFRQTFIEAPTTPWDQRRETKPSSPRDANAISGMFNVCGATASYGQYSSVNAAGTAWRSGVNNNWYSMRWGGNGATGARSVAQGSADAFSLLGKSMFYLGASISAVQGVQAYRQGNYGRTAKSALDIVMGRVALAGPQGAAAGVLYFGVDMTVGWDSTIQDAQKRAPSQCIMNSGVWLPF